VATGRASVGVPSGGEAGLPGAGGLGGVHRCVSGLEQLERLAVVDGVDEGYPDTCSDGEGGVAVVNGNGCRAVHLVDVTSRSCLSMGAKSSTGNSSPTAGR